MKQLAVIATVIGAISMVIAIVIRIMVKEVMLGLAPSSFLEFSIACFLLTLALDKISK